MSALSTVIGRGALASRAAAGNVGRVYFATDYGAFYRDNGSSWDKISDVGGTANPGSPATNDRFFRTDLGLEVYYDGTRWVTLTLYREPFHYAGSVMPLTTTGTMGRLTPWATTYDLWLDAFYTSTYVLTTNNGTNFWTVALIKKDAADTGTTVVSFTTAADTASNWTQRRTAIGAAYVAASFREFDVTGTKTLSGGNLFWAIAMAYRLIAT